MSAQNPTLEFALVEQLAAWQVHTRAVMTSMLALADYFGPRTSRPSLEHALVGSVWLVERIAYPQPPLLDRPKTTAVFRTRSKRLAGMLSPLVQLICVPVPSFVGLTRELPDGMPTLRTFAELSGHFWQSVARPLFLSHPEVAPEDWLRMNADRLRRRRG